MMYEKKDIKEILRSHNISDENWVFVETPCFSYYQYTHIPQKFKGFENITPPAKIDNFCINVNSYIFNQNLINRIKNIKPNYKYGIYEMYKNDIEQLILRCVIIQPLKNIRINLVNKILKPQAKIII